jgi:hypothetical protein
MDGAMRKENKMMEEEENRNKERKRHSTKREGT